MAMDQGKFSLDLGFWSKKQSFVISYFTVFILYIFSLNSHGQIGNRLDLNQYDYIVIDQIIGKNSKELRKFYTKNLQKAGFEVINLIKPNKTHEFYPAKLTENPNSALYLIGEQNINGCYHVKTTLIDINGDIKLTSIGSSCGLLSTAVKNSISNISTSSFRISSNIPIPDKNYVFQSERRTDYTLSKLKEEWLLSGLDGIEGIYEKISDGRTSKYTIGIKKKNNTEYSILYLGGVIDRYKDKWKEGDLKGKMYKTATPNIFKVDWYNADETVNSDCYISVENGSMTMYWSNNSEHVYLKLYPISGVGINTPKSISGNWESNGSGLIISKSGYIVTNHHVIEEAEDIEVEFIINGEVKMFNAEIVQSDKVNDLAIIKILDMNFDGLDEIQYNFKSRSSDVGTKVYAYGYPMALSLMGKEIKVTDGIINSKTGLDGDITTYQISATIQPGSSGGPLFDDKGSLIGINSSGLARLGSETTGYSIKTSYVLNLIDVLPNSFELPSSKKLESMPLTEQIKEISKYVVLIKVK